MARPKKIVDFSEPRGIGDNSDAALRDYVARYADCVARIEAIRGEGKDILNEAKGDGFLKTAIRKAIRNLKMSEEQKQAKKEVDSETDRITELCADLPLFSQ